MEAVRVGVVMGGVSSEREVSLRSGEAVAEALDALGHEVVRIDMGGGLDALSVLSDADMDVAFLALHGKQGEDGCVQGVLEMLGIPYTGSGVLTSALAMDKLKTKELLRLHNVPTPPYYVYRRDSADAVGDVHGSFGFPVVVKPRREGSSVGVTRAENLAELTQAVETALLFDDCALVERFIAGAEIAVAILDGRVLGAIEIEPASGFYEWRMLDGVKQPYYISRADGEPMVFAALWERWSRAEESLDSCVMITSAANGFMQQLHTRMPVTRMVEEECMTRMTRS